MAEFDPFEREFRRQAAGLRRNPSPRSWNRLERRLDRRASGGRIFNIRPWMIAALVLLVAGTFALTEAAQSNSNVLAQRSESIQELSVPYTPEEEFIPGDYLGGPGEEIEQREGFRDVMVAEKHRVAG